MKNRLAWTFVLCVLIALPAVGGDWYVDPVAAPGGDGSPDQPFATLGEAVTALPGAPAGPLILRLAEGVHRIAQPLLITPRETRGQPLTFRGGVGVSISGGRPLRDWRVEGDRWMHPWDNGPVREVFVNGRRAPRSRFPVEGWLRVEEALPDKRSGFTCRDDLPAFESGLELVFLHDWSISRIPVASIDGRLLKTTGPIGFPANHYRIDHFEPHPRFCLENGLAFLREPGTWCLDEAGKRIVYLPRVQDRLRDVSGETTSGVTPCAFVVPVARALVRVSGTPDEPVTRVRFERVAFSHCRYDLPPSGYAEGQATKHVPRDRPVSGQNAHTAWAFVPWAVEVEWAHRVSFEACDVSNLGGSGVLLGAGTRDCTIRGCTVRDVSGNGIGIGEGGERRLPNGQPWWTAAPDQVATGNRVERCEVTRCGRQFHGAVGIWAGLVRDVSIAHNRVHHLPYTGISVGWMWNPTPSPCGGNRVEDNHIHHVMQVLSDGGGIYTLGRQPGTMLRRNHIHDVPLNLGRAESNGMFLDEGSSEFVIESNLIHGTVRSPLRFHKAGALTVRRNVWLLPPDTPPLRFNNTPPENIDADGNRAFAEDALPREIARWKAEGGGGP